MANPTELDLILRALELMQGDAQPSTSKPAKGRKATKAWTPQRRAAHSKAIKAGQRKAKAAARKPARKKATAKK